MLYLIHVTKPASPVPSDVGITWARHSHLPGYSHLGLVSVLDLMLMNVVLVLPKILSFSLVINICVIFPPGVFQVITTPGQMKLGDRNTVKRVSIHHLHNGNG